MVDCDLFGQLCGVVAAQEAAAVRIDTEAEVADPDLKHCVADNGGYGRDYSRVDL